MVAVIGEQVVVTSSGSHVVCNTRIADSFGVRSGPASTHMAGVDHYSLRRTTIFITFVHQEALTIL